MLKVVCKQILNNSVNRRMDELMKEQTENFVQFNSIYLAEVSNNDDSKALLNPEKSHFQCGLNGC